MSIFLPLKSVQNCCLGDFRKFITNCKYDKYFNLSNICVWYSYNSKKLSARPNLFSNSCSTKLQSKYRLSSKTLY